MHFYFLTRKFAAKLLFYLRFNCFPLIAVVDAISAHKSFEFCNFTFRYRLYVCVIFCTRVVNTRHPRVALVRDERWRATGSFWERRDKRMTIKKKTNKQKLRWHYFGLGRSGNVNYCAVSLHGRACPAVRCYNKHDE